MLTEIDRFVNWIRRRNPAAYTWHSYRYDLHQFIETVGDLPAAEITLHHIDDFIQAQADRGLQASTINRSLVALNSLYRFLSEEDGEIDCPIIPHRHFLRQPRRLPRSVPHEEIDKLFAVITEPRDRAIFLLMLRCGLRISEVSKLNLRDLYLSERPSRLQVLGKNSKERAVYLSAQVEKAVRDYLAVRPSTTDTPALFLTYKNTRLGVRSIQKRLAKYRDQAGVMLTPHQLRHNFANDLILADVPIASIQKLMGHEWIATTELYISANSAKVKKDFYQATQQVEAWYV